MPLNKEEILKRVSSYEILIYFLTPFTGGKKLRKDEHILSPLRDESTPSFCIFPSKGSSDDWAWYDHGAGEGGSAFDLVIKLHKNCSFIESLKLVDHAFVLGLDNPDPTYTPPQRTPVPPPKSAAPAKSNWYDLKLQAWTQQGLEWWSRFGITKLTLDAYRVSEVLYYSAISNKSGKMYTINARPDQRIFCYSISDDSQKLYKPGTKQFKFQWLGNKPADYVFGLEQLPETGNLVLFTGGEKDVMALHALGFPAVCLNSETAKPSNELLSGLAERFDQVMFLYDIDATGRKKAVELSKITGLAHLTLPDFDGTDISDFVASGQADIVQTINTLIQNANSSNSLPLTQSQGTDLDSPNGNISTSKSETETSSDDGSQAVSQPQLRDWLYYTSLIKKLGVQVNPDFVRTRDGAIEVLYHEIGGKPYRVATNGGSKIPAKRRIGNGSRFNAVYLPPNMRIQGKDRYPFLVPSLIICQDELTAYILSEHGIPAVGLPRPNAFQSRPTQKVAHKLIKQVIREHDIKEILYLLPSEWHSLPIATATEDTVNQYEHQDASALAREGVATLGILHETFRLMPTRAIYPNANSKITYPNKYWVDQWLSMTLLDIETTDWLTDFDESSPKQIVYGLYNRIQAAGESENLLDSFSISGGTTFTYQEHLYLQSVDQFAAHYGIADLGYVFQWGKNVYEYDQRDGSISLAGNSRDAYSVSEREGRYWSRTKGDGERTISDFVMKYHLEVKQEDTFYLVEFTPLLGPPQFAVFSISDILSADTFKRKVADIPGSKFNFWGSKGDVEQLHAMSRSGVKEAQSLNNLLGYDRRNDFYVYGNGLLLTNGDFVEVDEYGLVQLSDKYYYLPALAKFNEDSNDFDAETDFVYEESGVEFGEWTDLFIKVHGETGSLVLCYLMAALYRDLIRSVGIEVFPHFSIFAPPESGKSSISKSLGRFFGKLKESNLRAGVTTASWDRKIELYHNSMLVLNEFNLSNKNVQSMRLDEYLVSIYDYQGREKTIRGKSRQSIPNSAILTIGQEPFWHREALASRGLIQELKSSRYRSQEERDRYNELKDMTSEGISAFNRYFYMHRHLIKDHIKAYVEDVYTILSEAVGGKSTARLIENYAICLAPVLLLIDKAGLKYPRTRHQLLEYAAQSVAEQSRRMISEGVLQIFFDFVQAEYGPGRLLGHQEVWFYRKANHLRIRIDIVHKLFKSYIDRENFGIENTGKGDLLGRLQNHPSFVNTTKGVQVGYKKNDRGYTRIDGNGSPLPSATGSLVVVLDYGKLQEDEGFALPDVAWTMEETLMASVPAKALY